MLWKNMPKKKEPVSGRMITGVKLQSLKSDQSRQSIPLSRRSSMRAIMHSNPSIFTVNSSRKSSHISQEIIPVTLQEVFTKYYNQAIVQKLITFTERHWEQEEAYFLQEFKIQAFVDLTREKCNLMTSLTQSLLLPSVFTTNERHLLLSALFQQTMRVMQQMSTTLTTIANKLPQKNILQQQQQLLHLCRMLLQLYPSQYSSDPNEIFFQQYVARRNKLRSQIGASLRPLFDFAFQVEKRLKEARRQIQRLQSRFAAVQLERNKYLQLLQKKANFTPIEIDYRRIDDIKQQGNAKLMAYFEDEIVKYHTNEHLRNEILIKELNAQIAQNRRRIDRYEEQEMQLKNELIRWQNSKAVTIDSQTQAYLIVEERVVESSEMDTLDKLLLGVTSPFGMGEVALSHLLNVIIVDRVLAEFQRKGAKSWRDWICEWFIIRTGSKRIAQVLIKNMQTALREYKNTHKRFQIFTLMCGFSKIKGRNMQQDLTYLFIQTAWPLVFKFALFYRNKLNSQAVGYPILPPLDCQQVFKLPLRKSYEIAEQFFLSEGIAVPNDLTQRIDHYAINEISKFHLSDPQFQKNNQEQIHILRQLTFDILLGFLLQYTAHLQTEAAERFLRALHIQQQGVGVLSYTHFQVVYKKFYKGKRARVQVLFARFCFIDQLRILDISRCEYFARALFDDGQPLIFDKIDSLKVYRVQEKRNTPLTYQLFRERYYQDMYDFYSTTHFINKTYSSIKSLLKKEHEDRIGILRKSQEWDKISSRLPTFSENILTIDQTVIHNMRRKQFVEICQQSWRTLRDLLSFIVE